MSNKEKFLKLVSSEDASTLESIKRRKENRAWLKKSQAIALKILQTLKAKKLRQKQLAEMLGVSPQQVNKWVRGNENFTLETISKIEDVLKVDLMNISFHKSSVKVVNQINQVVVYAPIVSHNYQMTKVVNRDNVIPMPKENIWSDQCNYGY